MEDSVTALNSLVVNAGIVGAIAIIIVIGLGWLLYTFLGKLSSIAEQFVVGVLEHLSKTTSQIEIHGSLMKELTETQREIKDTHLVIASRIEDLHRR